METKQIREALKPIVVSIDTLQLYNFRRIKRGQQVSIYFDMRVGNAFDVTNFEFHEDKFPQDGRGLIQSWQWARPLINEEAYWKAKIPDATDSLGQFLGEAIYQFAMEPKEQRKKVLNFLDGMSETLEFPTFKPKKWQGECLNIAFKGVGFSNFRFEDGEVTCHICLDHHLTFYDTTIYKESWGVDEKRILRPDLNQAMESLLNHHDVRRYAKDIYNKKLRPLISDSFLFCAHDFATEGPFSPVSIGPFTTA